MSTLCEKADERTKRQTLPKGTVEGTPNLRTTKVHQTPASVGSENHRAMIASCRKLSEPCSEDKTRLLMHTKKDLKSEAIETPRRKSEFTTKSRSRLVSNKGLADISTPTVVRRSAADFLTPDWFAPPSIGSSTAPVCKWPSEEEVASTSVNDLDNEIHSSCITVAVRVRPFLQRELSNPDEKNIVSMVDNETIVTTERGDIHRFTFDHSFWSFDDSSLNYASQCDVYTKIGQPLLAKVFEGYNVCLLAYGPTGSGKSYSMTGSSTDIGIIPRFCEELISHINEKAKDNLKTIVEISFFEIYNEKIHDLLASSNVKDKGSVKKMNLKVREHPVLGPYVEGLSSYVVSSYADIETWLSVGNKRRATAATGLNDTSSRSHSVFNLLLTQNKTETVDGVSHDHSSTSKVSLVDLAGSERQQMAKTTGDRLREGVSINKSLHMLGKVISVLAEQSACPARHRKRLFFIPYRDSVLTWLLKESLGGNSQTAMLATISPSSVHVEDTMSTLRYAKQASTIVNVARVNEDATARLVRVLRDQIEKLKQHTGSSKGNEVVIAESQQEIAWLREQLFRKECEMAEIKRAWHEKQQKSEEQKLEESRLLEREGITVSPDCRRPKLVNLAENPQLSEMLEYELRDGVSNVGRWKEDASHEILLRGPLIADDHCVIECSGSVVMLKVASEDAQTFVNGCQIVKSTSLHHGDRVILGDHFFRFCNPLEMPAGPCDSHPLRDFEFARQELAVKQNARLEAQLEEERVFHEQELASLRHQHRDAEYNMGMTLSKTLETAEMQRNKYEYRLQELERQLSEAKCRAVKSEMNSIQKAALIDRLENEKQLLKTEVDAMRWRLPSEPECTQDQVLDGNMTLSITGTFLEKLQRMKDELQEAVEQQKSRMFEAKTHDLQRLLLMIREANCISVHLQKNTEFSRQTVLVGEDQLETVIQVARNGTNLTTIWSLEKFEERLTLMREIYKDPSSYSLTDVDDIFYDPDDAWSMKADLSPSKLLSPHMLKGLRRQSSIGCTSVLDESLFSQSLLDDFDELNIAKEAKSFESLFELCQLLIRRSAESLKGFEAHGDVNYCIRVLTSCYHINACLSSFGQSHEILSTADKSIMHLETCVQLPAEYNSLSVLFCDWSASLCEESARDLFQTGFSIIAAIGSKLLLFIQGCTQCMSTMVDESSSAISVNLSILCQLCGEIALLQKLRLPTISRDFSLYGRTQISVNGDLKCQFISGCNQQLGKFLQLALKAVEDYEMKIIDCTENKTITIKSPLANNLCEELLKMVQISISSLRLMLQRLQALQAEDNLFAEEEEAGESLSCDSTYDNMIKLSENVETCVNCTSKLAKAADSILSEQDVERNLRVAAGCVKKIQKACSSIGPHSCLREDEALDLAAADVLSSLCQLETFIDKFTN